VAPGSFSCHRGPRRPPVGRYSDVQSSQLGRRYRGDGAVRGNISQRREPHCQRSPDHTRLLALTRATFLRARAPWPASSRRAAGVPAVSCSALRQPLEDGVVSNFVVSSVVTLDRCALGGSGQCIDVGGRGNERLLDVGATGVGVQQRLDPARRDRDVVGSGCYEYCCLVLDQRSRHVVEGAP
jgi:hypothetical protein